MKNVMDATETFAEAARAVARRHWQRQWWGLIIRSAPWVAGGLMVLAILWWFGRLSPLWLLLAFGGWITGITLRCFWKRPATFSLFSAWDALAGRGDAFASAWFFCQSGAPLTEGEKWHVRQAMALWARDGGQLESQMPLPQGRWKLVVPFLVLAFLLLPRSQGPLEAGDRPVSPETRDMVASEVMRLSRKGSELGALEGLNEDEQRLAKELELSMEETAASLGGEEGESTRDVLRRLEAAARKVDELTERLGDSGEAWASEAMLAEMKRHPDTADLADALAIKAAQSASEKALVLAESLGAGELATETLERLSEALKRAASSGDPGDENRLAGARVRAADRKLRAQDRSAAGAEFKKLAEALGVKAARDKARDEMKQLAEQLRQTGNRVTGSESMEKLAGQDGGAGGNAAGQAGGNAPTGGGAWENLPKTTLPESLAEALQNQIAGQTGQPMKGAAPQPGTDGAGFEAAEGTALALGQGKVDPEKPLFFAPIPGQDDEEAPEGGVLLAGAPKPGTGAGGLSAGTGTAPLESAETDLVKAANSSLVAGSSTEGGPTFSRSVEGTARPETGERSATGVAARFARAEEEAMEDDALPLSRREAVRRYFKALRQTLDP
jgi:hypothetical protein